MSYFKTKTHKWLAKQESQIKLKLPSTSDIRLKTKLDFILQDIAKAKEMNDKEDKTAKDISDVIEIVSKIKADINDSISQES